MLHRWLSLSFISTSRPEYALPFPVQVPESCAAHFHHLPPFPLAIPCRNLHCPHPLRYRLVKAWAAAHGLNDAAANTLNSWSLGLLVAFYLQVGQSIVTLRPCSMGSSCATVIFVVFCVCMHL
jgi:hypothetical protein